MSVERIRRKDGTVVWCTRWREGGRNRSRVYSTKRDAQLADAEMVRRRRLGTLAQVDAETETLDEFVTDVWGPVHAAQLAPSTRELYAGLYRVHIGPYLGDTALRAFTGAGLRTWQRNGCAPKRDRRRCGAPSGFSAASCSAP